MACAMVALELRAVGSLTGVLPPKEPLVRLKVGKGETLSAGETPSG